MTGQVKQISEDQSFAERLRAAMWDAGVGVGQLSVKTGINSRLIAKYRKGANEPRDYFGRPTPNAVLLAEALGVAVDWLVPLTHDHEPRAAA
jgi:hypothetical protein